MAPRAPLASPESLPASGLADSPETATPSRTVPAGLVGGWIGAVATSIAPGIPVSLRLDLTGTATNGVVGSEIATTSSSKCTFPLSLVEVNGATEDLDYRQTGNLGTAAGVLQRA
jgi:hypothetical protein